MDKLKKLVCCRIVGVMIDEVVVFVGVLLMIVLWVINKGKVCDVICECVLCVVCELGYMFNFVVSLLVVV